MNVKDNNTYTIQYSGFTMLINKCMGDIDVYCRSERRGYQIPETIVKIEQEDQYVYLTTVQDNIWQFKFEDGDFLVGDKFDHTGNHIDVFAMHVFGEE